MNTLIKCIVTILMVTIFTGCANITTQKTNNNVRAFVEITKEAGKIIKKGISKFEFISGGTLYNNFYRLDNFSRDKYPTEARADNAKDPVVWGGAEFTWTKEDGSPWYDELGTPSADAVGNPTLDTNGNPRFNPWIRIYFVNGVGAKPYYHYYAVEGCGFESPTLNGITINYPKTFGECMDRIAKAVGDGTSTSRQIKIICTECQKIDIPYCVAYPLRCAAAIVVAVIVIAVIANSGGSRSGRSTSGGQNDGSHRPAPNN